MKSTVLIYSIFGSGIYLSYEPSYPSVGLSFCHNLLKRQRFLLPCSYRSTCLPLYCLFKGMVYGTDWTTRCTSRATCTSCSSAISAPVWPTGQRVEANDFYMLICLALAQTRLIGREHKNIDFHFCYTQAL